MIKKLLIIATALLPMMAAAETLQECRALAQENYPLVKRYDLIKATEALTLDNAGKAWLPQVTATGQATYQSAVSSMGDVLSSIMPDMASSMKGLSKFQYRVGLDVNQTVYDGGSIKAGNELTQAQSVAEQASNDVDIYAVQSRVDDLYFGVLLMDERLRLNDEMITLLKSNVEKMTKLYRGGVAMGSDVDLMKVELATAQQQRVEMEAGRETLVKVLSLLCGKPIASVVRPPVPGSTSGVRPELASFDRQLDLTLAQEKVLDSNLKPRVSLFAQGYYGYTGYNMFRDMMHRSPTLNGMIGARITWNIGSLYTRKNDLSKLKVQRDNIENARETFLFNQSLQSEQQLGNAEQYRKLMAQDDEIIKLRASVRRAAQAKLNGGIIDTHNLLQEITNEHQAAINKSIHEVEYLKSLYQLQTIQGK